MQTDQITSQLARQLLLTQREVRKLKIQTLELRLMIDELQDIVKYGK